MPTINDAIEILEVAKDHTDYCVYAESLIRDALTMLKSIERADGLEIRTIMKYHNENSGINITQFIADELNKRIFGEE